MATRPASRKAVKAVPKRAIEKDASNLDEALSSEEESSSEGRGSSEPESPQGTPSELKDERDAARDQMLHGFRRVYGWTAYWVFVVFCILGVGLIVIELSSNEGLDNVEFAASMGFFGAVLAIVTGIAKGLFGGNN